MKFDLSNIDEVTKAFSYLTELSGKHEVVDVVKVSPKRSLNQNNYLYFTFNVFSLESGYSAQEAKTLFKREVNPHLFVYEKRGLKFLKSTKDLDTKQMTDSIDRWRKYAAENGIDIPSPDNSDALIYWGNRIEKEGKWL